MRALFLLEGFSMGAWGAHVPSVQRQHALGEAALALALLAVMAGALASLGLASRALAAWGPRRVVACAGLLMSASLASLLLPASYAGLLLALALLGFGATLADVAMNAEASELEARSGQRLMSGLHGMFSLGGMLGAATVALLLAQAWPPAEQLLLLGLLVGLGVLPAALALPARLAAAPGRQPDAATGPLRPQLLLLGGLAAVGMMAEGAMYDWSVLYLETETGAAPSLAALAYAAFSGAMALGRFSGDALRGRMPPQQLLSGGALLSALGVGLALLSADPLLGLLGFALAGLGLANAVPLFFLAAARLPGLPPAAGIARVAALGFLGFLAGPPLIGAAAAASSLRWALGLVLLAALGLALAGLRLRLAPPR